MVAFSPVDLFEGFFCQIHQVLFVLSLKYPVLVEVGRSMLFLREYPAEGPLQGSWVYQFSWDVVRMLQTRVEINNCLYKKRFSLYQPLLKDSARLSFT